MIRYMRSLKIVKETYGFGTSNGISFRIQKRKTGQWHSFLSSFDKQLKDKNHIFITLCEVSPGVIWAGGYTSGIYKINKKKTLAVEIISRLSCLVLSNMTR